MEREEEKTVIHNHYAPGANCQVFNGPISGAVFAMPGAHVVQQAPATAQKEKHQETNMNDEQDAVVRQLLPVFFGVEKDAREFLSAIQGMTSVQITQTVKRWAAEGRISPLSKKRALWKVLHDNGVYPKSESNWNRMV